MRAHSNAHLTIELPGTPVPKPRMTQRDRWNPSRAALKYFAWKDHVAWHAASIIHNPFEHALVISAMFWLPVPKSTPTKERMQRLREMHTMKPDLKNLVAGLEDALNKVAWVDDAQIMAYRSAMKGWTNEAQGYTTLQIFPMYDELDVAGAIERARAAMAGPQIRLPMEVRRG